MSDMQRKKLDAEISAVETRLRTRSAELKRAQDQWLDWEAGKLRAQIAQDQRTWLNLKSQRQSLEPLEPKRTSGVFTGSNF